MGKQSIIIIGSGWAGATLSGALNDTKYSITIISPETTTPYTPLLASAACGLYDFSLVETPIRRTGKNIKFLKAVVEGINFKAKTLQCTPAFPDEVALPVDKFELSYDIVVIAPGVSASGHSLKYTNRVNSASTKRSELLAWPKMPSSSAPPKTQWSSRKR
jgi:NADH:ubiquinone reductase (non-electrogenic)